MLFKILVLLAVCIFTKARISSLTELTKYEDRPRPLPILTVTPPPTPPPRIYPEDAVTSDLSCNISKRCPTGYACRATNGRIVNNHNQYGGGPFYRGGGLGNQQGTCGCATRPGEICNADKDCPKNYLCYAQMQGVCCPVPHCYTKDYVEYWRAYWNNCKPPTCFFPAK